MEFGIANAECGKLKHRAERKEKVKDRGLEEGKDRRLEGERVERTEDGKFRN
jgi:hypothetical protein